MAAIGFHPTVVRPSLIRLPSKADASTVACAVVFGARDTAAAVL